MQCYLQNSCSVVQLSYKTRKIWPPKFHVSNKFMVLCWVMFIHSYPEAYGAGRTHFGHSWNTFIWMLGLRPRYDWCLYPQFSGAHFGSRKLGRRLRWENWRRVESPGKKEAQECETAESSSRAQSAVWHNVEFLWVLPCYLCWQHWNWCQEMACTSTRNMLQVAALKVAQCSFQTLPSFPHLLPVFTRSQSTKYILVIWRSLLGPA